MDRLRLWTARYTLVPLRRLGSKAAQRPRQGALLRLDAPDASGYADLFPWPELGDLPLRKQLDALSTGQSTPLSKRSLACARADAEARRLKCSLFEGGDVPESHRLLSDISAVEDISLAAIEARGFTHVKLKLGARFDDELNALVAAAVESGLRFRLDLNASVSCDRLMVGLDRLQRSWAPSPLTNRIDFLEDPCPYNGSAWRRIGETFGIGRALDRERAEASLSGVSHRVIKPAVDEPDETARAALAHGCRLVVTSYLDHPVGQLHAASVAGALRARHGDSVVCAGLLSHDAYEPTAYSEALPVDGPRLMTAELGPGIGFDELLERESWERLS